MRTEIHNLSAGYGGTTIIENLNLVLGEGEILMLLGSTGCGKTTILRVLAGLIPPTAGEIRLGERRIDAKKVLPTEKRHVGMVFQDFALFPHLSVEKNIGFRMRDKSRVEHWLRVLNLEKHRRAMPDTLSGGQKQRVALARSLAHEPALMLLDEPLSNLDASLKDELRWMIRGVLKEANVPAIWVTHDQEEALTAADRVGILHRGRLEQLDTPENCFARPASRFVAEFLGEACFLPSRLENGRAHSALGSAEADAVAGAEGEVDLLVRPDDLAFGESQAANGTLAWARFEGSSRLYAVDLQENGPRVKVRVNHEVELTPGEQVNVKISAKHPLMAFARAQA